MSLLEQRGFVSPDELPVYRRVLLFGRPGCGKTSGMMTASDAFFIGTERGIASLAQAGTIHQGTGDLLPTFKKPVKVDEFEGATGIMKLHNDLLFFYEQGGFRDPNLLYPGLKTMCIDGIDTIRKYVNEAYDKETGRLNEMRNENQMFNKKDMANQELGKRAAPYNKILKIIEHANMHIVMSCRSNDFDFQNSRLRKDEKWKWRDDEPAAAPKVQYMCDIVIEILEPTRKEIPKNATDKYGWYKVYNKSRFGGNWRQGCVGQHFDFDKMCHELRQLELAGMVRKEDDLDIPEAKQTMQPVDNTGGMDEKVKMCLANVRIQELAVQLGIPEGALIKGIHKYEGDPEVVIKNLEAKLEPPPPEEEF